jgi:hypothetical protein
MRTMHQVKAAEAGGHPLYIRNAFEGFQSTRFVAVQFQSFWKLQGGGGSHLARSAIAPTQSEEANR